MASKPTKSKAGEASEERRDTAAPVQERKLHLQEECRILTRHLDTYLGRAEQLLQAIQGLAKEARDTEEQSRSYLRCGAKLSRDPPAAVIALNEQNRRDLARVRQQQKELMPRYAGEEQEASRALREAEAEDSHLDTELEELEPCKEQKGRAEQRLKALQKELRVTRIRCAEESHAARSRFLQEKADCEQELQQRMQQLTRGAQDVALRALSRHLQQVRAENRLLRQELLGLLRHSKLLRDTKMRLQDQQEQLLRENRCAQRAALLSPARAPRHGQPALLPRPPPNRLPHTWRN